MPDLSAPLGLAASGAELLAKSCGVGDGSGSGPGPLEVTGELALELTDELRSLSNISPVDAEVLVEGAAQAADLANLAACAIARMPGERALAAAAASHMAAGAARALAALAIPAAADLQGSRAENLRRDILGARWRAKLAIRQAEAATEKFL